MAALSNLDPMTIVILGLIALVPVTNGVLSILAHFRKDPPAHHYALRHEIDKDLDKLESRINARIAIELSGIHRSIGEVKKDVDDMSRTLLSELKELNRSIGNLEGGSK